MTTATPSEVLVDGIEMPMNEIALAQKAQALAITDDATETAALMVIADCRGVEKQADAERREKTDPLNLRIELVSAPFNKRRDFFKAIRIRLDTELTKYRTAKALRLQQDQQRLIEEKRRADAEAEAKAAKERERLRQMEEDMRASSAVPTASQQKALASQEAKVEKAVAHEAEVKAAPIQVVEQVQKTVELADGTKITSRKNKVPAFANGVPTDTVFDRSDPRFKVGASVELPDNCFVFDLARLKAMMKVGIVPPGVIEIDAPTLAVRKAKA